jgi:hypothetical protein
MKKVVKIEPYKFYKILDIAINETIVVYSLTSGYVNNKSLEFPAFVIFDSINRLEEHKIENFSIHEKYFNIYEIKYNITDKEIDLIKEKIPIFNLIRKRKSNKLSLINL